MMYIFLDFSLQLFVQYCVLVVLCSFSELSVAIIVNGTAVVCSPLHHCYSCYVFQ
jgi:hypothetical protein